MKMTITDTNGVDWVFDGRSLYKYEYGGEMSGYYCNSIGGAVEILLEGEILEEVTFKIRPHKELVMRNFKDTNMIEILTDKQIEKENQDK